MRSFVFALLVALLPHPVFAQHPDKQPTAQISSSRSLSDLGFERAAEQDATLQGGSAYGGSDSRVPTWSLYLRAQSVRTPLAVTAASSMIGCGPQAAALQRSIVECRQVTA